MKLIIDLYDYKNPYDLYLLILHSYPLGVQYKPNFNLSILAVGQTLKYNYENSYKMQQDVIELHTHLLNINIDEWNKYKTDEDFLLERPIHIILN